jgi:hypothetical protein
VWKYELKPDLNAIDMPEGAQLLRAAMQRSTPYLWALVNPVHRYATREVWVLGTGWPVPNGVDYVCSFTMDWMEFHVFTADAVRAVVGPLLPATTEPGKSVLLEPGEVYLPLTPPTTTEDVDSLKTTTVTTETNPDGNR